MRDGSWKKMQKGWLHPRVDTITLHRVLHSEEEKICVYIYIFFVCIYIYIYIDIMPLPSFLASLAKSRHAFLMVSNTVYRIYI